jgi:hypothetical protein
MEINRMNVTISKQTAANIRELANNDTNILWKITGKLALHIVPLSMYLLKKELGYKKLSKQTWKYEVEYVDKVYWLIWNGYIRTQDYPYRLILTDKFKELE